MERISFPLELKASNEKGKIEGYAAVFGNLDYGRDVIVEGAFKGFKRTRDGKIRMALFHDLERLAGKATVYQDSHGLGFEGQLNLGVSYVADAYPLIKDGTLDGVSVGFDINPDGAEWESDYQGKGPARVLKDLELWEFSLVPFGMNPEALVEDVKAADMLTDPRRFETFLRKSGFSRREAKAITSGGFGALQRDAATNNSETLEEIKQAIASCYQ